MTAAEATGLEIVERATTRIVRINGGRHALFTQKIAVQLGKLVDRADKDPNIRAVVFTGAHPDRFLSRADVAWLQAGGVGFPPVNTCVAGMVSRMARDDVGTPRAVFDPFDIDAKLNSAYVVMAFSSARETSGAG